MGAPVVASKVSKFRRSTRWLPSGLMAWVNEPPT